MQSYNNEEASLRKGAYQRAGDTALLFTGLLRHADMANDAAASDKRHSGVKESSKLEQSRFLPWIGSLASW